MTSQSKRHKITLTEAVNQIRIHQSQPITAVEWRWYETAEGHEAFFILFSARITNPDMGATKQYRWQVFEEGTIAAGGILGYA
jgi:hypothetical protein